MEAKENLRNFYENELKEAIASLEKYRARSRKLIWRAVLATFIFVVLVLLLRWAKNNTSFFNDKYSFYLYLQFFFFIFWIFFTARAYGAYQNYQRRFKRSVIRELVAYINPAFSYDPHNNVSGKDYLDSRLTHTSCDVYSGEDYVSGIIDKTPFGFSEVTVRAVRWKKYKSYEENLKWIKELERRKEIYNTFVQSSATSNDDEVAEVGDILVGIKKILQVYTKVFKGLFFIADFNKNLNESTFVVSEKEYAVLGREKKKVEHYGELVKLENPEFEKIFSVYGSSPQEARYVLTPTMMEAIVNVHKTYNMKMKFSFTGSKVYCAIAMKKNMFEPTIKRDVKYNDIEEFYTILNLIETIITEMNLNTRIWTKK